MNQWDLMMIPPPNDVYDENFCTREVSIPQSNQDSNFHDQ
jgi:hypothetical protein